MPVTSNLDEIRRKLDRMNPNERVTLIRDSLTEIGLLIATNSQLSMKRGGKAKPLRTKLTSRTGTGRRSIRSNRPGRGFVDIGTDLGYMAMHEEGGTFSVKAHTRTSSLGNSYRVKAHTMRVPRRAFLEPGLKKSQGGMEKIFERHLRKMLETA